MTTNTVAGGVNAAEFLALAEEMDRVKKLEGGVSFVVELFEAIIEPVGLAVVDRADVERLRSELMRTVLAAERSSIGSVVVAMCGVSWRSRASTGEHKYFMQGDYLWHKHVNCPRCRELIGDER